MSDDRTSEFQALARSLPASDLRRGTNTSGSLLSNHVGGGSAMTSSSSIKDVSSTAAMSAGDKGAAAKNNPAYAELRSFQLTAGGISKDIAGTSAWLTELTELVRNQSSILTDPADTERINELVLRIKGSIENLNSRLDQAAQVIARQKRRLGQSSQAGQQASNLVDELKTEFAQAASGFKKVLQQRTDSMKETDYLQRQVYASGQPGDQEDDNPIPNMSLAPPPVFGDSSSFSNNANYAGGPAGGASFPTLDLTSGMMSTGEATGSALPRPHGISYGGNGMTTPSYHTNTTSQGGLFFDEDESNQGGGGGMPMTPLDIQRMEQESGLQTQLIPDQQYLQNRAEAMSAVEAHIVELGTVYNKLAGMVAEHREMVHRVEDNVEDANTNISLSLNVLTDTLTSLRTNKGLALRVLAVLVTFIIMFVVFFA